MTRNSSLRNFFGSPLTVFFDEPSKSCGYGARRYSEARYGRSDFEEKENEYVVELEVPGIQKENIKVDLKEHVLTVSWSRKREQEKSEKGHYERPEGDFSRKYYVKGADSEQVKADLKDGILTIRLGKQETVKEKSIQIN